MQRRRASSVILVGYRQQPTRWLLPCVVVAPELACTVENRSAEFILFIDGLRGGHDGVILVQEVPPDLHKDPTPAAGRMLTYRSNEEVALSRLLQA